MRDYSTAVCATTQRTKVFCFFFSKKRKRFFLKKKRIATGDRES
jgi:hypothetical protein